MSITSKLETAMRLLEEVRQVLASQEKAPPSDISSEEDTKPVSEEVRPNSDESTSPQKNTNNRSERQVAACKANFERRWGNTKKEQSSQPTSVYDQIC